MKSKHKKEALKEVLILRSLSHPHIIKQVYPITCRYYHSFIEQDCLYILMEYAEGGDLHSVSTSLKLKVNKWPHHNFVSFFINS
jgi:NIMA (never in mitosis gene a)-related kinase 1/4/5